MRGLKTLVNNLIEEKFDFSVNFFYSEIRVTLYPRYVNPEIAKKLNKYKFRLVDNKFIRSFELKRD